MPTRSVRRWGLGAAAALAALFGARALAARGSCPYPPAGLPPFPRTQAELIRRIHARIVEANPALDVPRCAEDRSCALVVAGALAQAQGWRLPPDLVTAIAWRESSFNLHIDNVTQRIAEGREIGPMQVRPIAFRAVGMNPEAMIGMPAPARIQYAVGAGIAYLHRLRTHYLPHGSWCSILHAYNVGPTAYRRGVRNQPYVDSVIAQALRYSELR